YKVTLPVWIGKPFARLGKMTRCILSAIRLIWVRECKMKIKSPIWILYLVHSQNTEIWTTFPFGFINLKNISKDLMQNQHLFQPILFVKDNKSLCYGQRF